MKIFSKALVGTVAAGAMVLVATPAAARDRYRDGISAGDIIAGALIIGGIAAVAGSIGNNRGYNGTYGGPYYGGYDGRYGDRYGYSWDNPRQAVERCVSAAQRGAYGARVTDIRRVDRNRYGYNIRGTVIVNERGGGWDRDYNYGYAGRNYDQGRFSCQVQNGQVVGLDFSGLRGNRYRSGYNYGYGW